LVEKASNDLASLSLQMTGPAHLASPDVFSLYSDKTAKNPLKFFFVFWKVSFFESFRKTYFSVDLLRKEDLLTRSRFLYFRNTEGTTIYIIIAMSSNIVIEP